MFTFYTGTIVQLILKCTAIFWDQFFVISCTIKGFVVSKTNLNKYIYNGGCQVETGKIRSSSSVPSLSSFLPFSSISLKSSSLYRLLETWWIILAQKSCSLKSFTHIILEFFLIKCGLLAKASISGQPGPSAQQSRALKVGSIQKVAGSKKHPFVQLGHLMLPYYRTLCLCCSSRLMPCFFSAL